jgi:hypothetical protein
MGDPTHQHELLLWAVKIRVVGLVDRAPWMLIGEARWANGVTAGTIPIVARDDAGEHRHE